MRFAGWCGAIEWVAIPTGKRVQFDDETWEEIVALSKREGRTFEQLTDEAYHLPCSRS
jgi:hypothetical protein